MPATAAPYGNYRGYAGSTARHNAHAPLAAHVPDPRLLLLNDAFPDLLKHKNIVDIGCNTGRVSIDAALYFDAKRVYGVELDPELVVTAKRNLSSTFSRIRSLSPPPENNEHPEAAQTTAATGKGTREGKIYFPISAVQKHGHVPYPRSEGWEKRFPGNVSFETADAVSWWPGERKVEVVLALSVFKWIHLWHGDIGLESVIGWIEEVFERNVQGEVRNPEEAGEGEEEERPKKRRKAAKGHAGKGTSKGERWKGHLVIEVQDWRSYEKAVGKVKELAGKLDGLKLRPGTWKLWLEGRGWELEGKLELGGRVIEVWRWEGKGER